ncbi:MAG: hypothetical protein HDR82_08920 [Bacteroides sp.]|nr:hypothetical protein [Bacteroides sp.]
MFSISKKIRLFGLCVVVIVMQRYNHTHRFSMQIYNARVTFIFAGKICHPNKGCPVVRVIGVINDKKELHHEVPFYWFPIGTISKVKKIVLGLRYKGHTFFSYYQRKKYVVQHSFIICLVFLTSQNLSID